ncbi:glycerophosphodiester phosphodiesterase [Microbulbifer celer]|uniref:Glycerophosphodiester phosphodiesterase n=1 Tax=Microbulbifer celer TaxID=435905 RepID=A0ABW3U480_9GAMM|nr:glycerophosphodiester phosphodiesterase [Microbulbifer celer]UFN57688.1 glycerophosphodiester phosphodiesterase [Microbulbifer celer]
MLKKILYLLLLAMVIFIGWRWLAAKPAPDTGLQFPIPAINDSGQPRPLIISHADDSGQGLYPGNTREFLQQMAALKVDSLEMDIHATADGELVLMHDDTVDRTTDGNGAIRDLTLAQLRELNVAHNWTQDGKTFPYRENPQKILTLDEVFETFPRYPMVIELKTPDPAAADSLCRTVRAFNKSNQVIISSFHQPAIDAFREHCPHVATGAGSDEVRLFAIASRLKAMRLVTPRYQALHIPVEYNGIKLISPESVEQAQSRGIRVDVWTVNEEEEMRRLAEMGVDGIMTDRPDRLRKVLDEMEAEKN